MKLITEKEPHRIVAEEGKHIRSIDDVYVPEHKDEEGNVIPEYFPYYSEEIYVPNTFTEEQINELYIEEEKEVD